MKEAFEILKKHKNKLNRQQISTLKGQILKGDINGFKKGLKSITTKNEK